MIFENSSVRSAALRSPLSAWEPNGVARRRHDGGTLGRRSPPPLIVAQPGTPVATSGAGVPSRTPHVSAVTRTVATWSTASTGCGRSSRTARESATCSGGRLLSRTRRLETLLPAARIRSVMACKDRPQVSGPRGRFAPSMTEQSRTAFVVPGGPVWASRPSSTRTRFESRAHCGVQ